MTVFRCDLGSMQDDSAQCIIGFGHMKMRMALLLLPAVQLYCLRRSAWSCTF